MKKLKIIYIFIFLLFYVSYLYTMRIEYINIPTAEVVDYGLGGMNVRLYIPGSAVARIIFSPFNRVNFGGSIDIENLLGRETPTIRDPEFYFKWRIFDGTKYFPAVAIGYDGQEYNFVAEKNEYTIPAKGLFLAFTINILTKGMFSDFGFNITRPYREEKSQLFGFIGCRYNIEETVNIMVEYENIYKESLHQLNAGISILPAKTFSIDLIFGNCYSKNPNITREIKVNYFYKFL